MNAIIYSPEKVELRAEGLIFDMDGVLFDTERDSVLNIIATAADMGFTITREFVLENMGRNLSDVKAIYSQAMGPSFDSELFWERYWQKRNENYDRDGMPLKPKAVELVKLAYEKSVPCSICSASPTKEVLRSLERADLTSYFKGVVGGEMVSSGKPAPDIFLKGAELIGAPPEKCAVIEDSLNWLKAGRAAGMIVVFVKDLKSYAEDELSKYCDYSFDTAAEVAHLIR